MMFLFFFPFIFWYFKMSIYENILLSAIKYLCILSSKLFYFGHSLEKMIKWCADNKNRSGTGEKVVF